MRTLEGNCAFTMLFSKDEKFSKIDSKNNAIRFSIHSGKFVFCKLLLILDRLFWWKLSRLSHTQHSEKLL